MALLFFARSATSSPFPSKYRIRGTWSIPYWPSIHESIEIHTDLTTNPPRQAILNYNGIASSIQFFNVTKYTIQATPNGTSCFASVHDMEKESDVMTVFLPDYTTSNWEPQGEHVILGRLCQKYHHQDPDVPAWYTDFYVDNETLDPVRYFMHGASIQHSHPADYYFDIDEWGPTIDEAAFIPPADCNTSSFPGPTRKLRQTRYSDQKMQIDPPVQDYCEIIEDSTVPGDLPASFSWRGRGIVPRPRDQANCGSCWAQAAGQAISAQLNLRNPEASENNKIDISVQQIVDCTWFDAKNANHACAGGDGWAAYQMLIDSNISLVSETEYPYIGVGGICSMPTTGLVARVTGCRQLKPKGATWQERADAIKRTLYKYGPLMVYIVASQKGFYPLQGTTIYSDPTCMPDQKYNEGVDHGVLLTGWKDEDGVQAWEIENSWSDMWADEGFGFIDMKYDCGIDSMILWPSVEPITEND